MLKISSHMPQRLLLLLGLSLLLSLAACGNLGASSSSSLLNKNLVANGDAEGGQGASNSTTLVAIPGWSKRINQTNVILYAASAEANRISVHDAGPANRGKNYFSGGAGNDTISGLEQVIDISALSDQIQSQAIHFTLSAYLGGYANRPDYASFGLGFQDAQGHQFKGVEVGPVYVADRHNQTGMLLRTLTGAIPAGTRKIDLTLTFFKATNLEGPGNTACADNLSLILSAN
jgi:hypothetical protein